jgi:hypothetical protein
VLFFSAALQALLVNLTTSDIPVSIMHAAELSKTPVPNRHEFHLYVELCLCIDDTTIVDNFHYQALKRYVLKLANKFTVAMFLFQSMTNNSTCNNATIWASKFRLQRTVWNHP